MIHAEKKFEELKQGLSPSKLTQSQEKIEQALKLAWRESHTDQVETSSHTKSWIWNVFGYGLTTSGIVGMALLSVQLVQPDELVQPSSVQEKKNDSNQIAPLSGGLSSPNMILGDVVEERLIIEPEFPEDDEYTYNSTEGAAQLLNESVILSIDVKDNILDVIHTLRTQTTAQQGYLLDISYHASYGTLDIKLPASQLDAFEEVLRGLDVNHEVEVKDYVVENLSEQIVTLDEQIQEIQAEINADKAQLNEVNLSSSEKEIIQARIIENEELITSLETDRAEKITQYDLISVRVIINEYSSIWDGNYTQYDRTTFFGMIKYELGRAIYTLIKSGSKVLRFFIWVAIYSIIFVPIILTLRKVVQKIMTRIRQYKVNRPAQK